MPRRHPPFLADEDGDEVDDIPDVGFGIIESGEIGDIFSSPNRASCINGLETLLGGDPQKKGGEATCVHVWSDAP